MAAVTTHGDSRADASTARPSRPTPVILVVDDHEDTRFLHRYVLESRGFRVVEAADGEEAVEAAERERPELILMDAELPRLDGLSATRRIRENPALRRVPVLFLSAHADPSYRVRARAAGGDDYLVKPVGLAALGEAVEKHLGGGATPRPGAVWLEL